MSVFTTVSVDELKPWLQAYPLGDLLELQGIASGISNTNYFVTTTIGRYVLTLFEEHSAEELPYFLDLMTHLAERGIPCPHPVRRLDGRQLEMLNGKPAALVSCLRGKDINQATPSHCAEVGRVLAEMHIAGLDFSGKNHDSRDVVWRTAVANKVLPFLNATDQAVLQQTMLKQAQLDIKALPQGVIHADLFRDNVLFDNENVGGVIDFYYACKGVLLYDLAIAVNDWCVDEVGALDPVRVNAMLQAYHIGRQLTQAEANVWVDMLQIAALRFWLSRLNDYHFPQSGELTHAKDPLHFERILKWSIKHQTEIAQFWFPFNN
jgi:homoserine kinase type II